MTSRTTESTTILLLGGGELGLELALAAREFGVRTVVADRRTDAPAFRAADHHEVGSLHGGDELERVVRAHDPDLVIPVSRILDVERLAALEREGVRVVPSAEAVALDRERVRRLAAEELGVRTPAFRVAADEAALLGACDELGYPCVVKPIAPHSGRGQSVVLGPARVEQAWAYAQQAAGAGTDPVLVEEWVEFEVEITLLALREPDGATSFVDPIGHRQERGEYRESWTPVELNELHLEAARHAARVLVDRLGGAGLYGVEFFVAGDEVVFSAISPGPHETGFVTLASQRPSQFELHLRAALGLPIPAVRYRSASAAAVILARGHGRVRSVEGLDRAGLVETAEVRLFGKPTAYPQRRMGVALASGDSAEEARARALEAAGRVEIRLE